MNLTKDVGVLHIGLLVACYKYSHCPLSLRRRHVRPIGDARQRLDRIQCERAKFESQGKWGPRTPSLLTTRGPSASNFISVPTLSFGASPLWDGGRERGACGFESWAPDDDCVWLILLVVL